MGERAVCLDVDRNSPKKKNNSSGLIGNFSVPSPKASLFLHIAADG